MSSRKIFPRAFLIGCDKNTEWMLEWFLKNYKFHANETRLIFANFGVSDRKRTMIQNNALFEGIMDMERKNPNEKTWFMKPETMWFAPVKECIWLDIDIEIKANIDGLFDHLVPGKLNMVRDDPWTKRRGEEWHNSGVVGFIDKPRILKDWALATSSGKHNQVGDQEVLHAMLNPITRIGAINTLPKEYNVLRLDVEHDNYTGPIRMMHWTGQKGKDRIKEQIGNA
jgi:hypothetical protein